MQHWLLPCSAYTRITSRVKPWVLLPALMLLSILIDIARRYNLSNFSNNYLSRISSNSVAERSFSLLNRVKMVVKPMAQSFLRNCR